MKVSNSDIKLMTAISYPFMLVFTFIIVFTLYPLCMLCTFADGREEADPCSGNRNIVSANESKRRDLSE